MTPPETDPDRKTASGAQDTPDASETSVEEQEEGVAQKPREGDEVGVDDETWTD